MGYQKANALAEKIPGTQLINISDREGDIYDMYHEASCRKQGVKSDFLIRAIKNRPLLDGKTGKKIRLYPPKIRKGKLMCHSVQVNAIAATEINPPPEAEPIEWLLITSLPIETAGQLKLALQYYLCRWQIEVFFRVLKSGCKIENLQLTTKERMDACLAIYLIIAWRTLFITLLDRSTKNVNCEIIFVQ